ncbi:MAG TPA: hypothetical protein VMH24_01195, partial [Candidatus Sulfotelmatobacter sp.]|nr:hypothetical protein [Candidatus Sulfotelmatobacter sp.]
MAPRRRTTRTPARTARRTRSAGFNLGVSPQTARALVGVVLLVIGAVTLIALLLPAGGLLNRYVSEFLRPAFGQGAWLLPLVLIAAGFLVERGPGTGTGWGVTALGGILIFLGGLGLIQLVWGHGTSPAQLAAAGGWVGQAFAGPTAALVSPAGAFVVLAGVVTAGLLLLLNSTIRGLLHPIAAGGHALAGVMAGPDAPAGRTGAGRGGAGEAGPTPRGSGVVTGGRRGVEVVPAEVAPPELPAPLSSPAPLSQTVWAGGRVGAGAAASATLIAPAVSATGDDDLLEAEDAPKPLHERPWLL